MTIVKKLSNCLYIVFFFISGQQKDKIYLSLDLKCDRSAIKLCTLTKYFVIIVILYMYTK